MPGTARRCKQLRSHRLEPRPQASKRRALGTLLAALLVVGPTRPVSAQAVESGAAPWLRIEAAEDPCVGPDALATEISRLLEGKPPARVTARLRSAAGGWALELWHATGQFALREFPVLPEDCAERTRALALVTVLALEHALEAQPRAEEQPPAAPGSRALVWSLGVAAGASVGELPGPAPVLGLDARVERGVWVPLELRGFADVRASSQATLAGATLVTRQLSASLATCMGGTPSSWRVDGCLGVELGAVLGDAASLPQARRDTAGSGALTLALPVRWSPRSHLGLTARIEGFIRFWVPAFQVLDAQGDPFAEQRLPLVGGRAWLGLSWLSQ